MIHPDDLRPGAYSTQYNPSLDAELAFPEPGSMTLQRFKDWSERNYVVSSLKKARGNIAAAAKLLGLERTYLHRKIRDHGIEKKEYF